MGDDNTNQKKRKSKCITSYSNMTAAQADKRPSLEQISVDRVLANANYDLDAILKIKEKVYDHRIVEYLRIEGYPTEVDPDFKEASINHLVYAVISPILDNFILITGRGMGDFVGVDLISVEQERFILIVEAMRNSLGQCLLSMKDMRDNNGGAGEVYGFVTTGEHWRMIRYDGTSFITTENFTALFGTMGTDKKRWMKDYSVVVDCMSR